MSFFKFNIFLFFITVFFVEVFLQYGWIYVLKKRHISQHIKKYGPTRHLEEKINTPTMGGVVFLVVFAGTGVVLKQFFQEIPAVIFLFPLGMGAIGFIDDWLKYSSRSSEGFKSRQKFLAQVFFCFLWIFLVYEYGEQAYIFVPFSRIADVGVTLFLGVGIVNAVNITDGLDGLAALCSLCSFSVLSAFSLFYGEIPSFLLAFSGSAISLAFLWHNGYPASVFMGDVGSHFLGGLLFGACVFYVNPWILLPLSSIFALEIFSVILQLGAIYGFHRKLFAMSPLHHHFELKGMSETHIVARFAMLHIVSMALFFALFQNFVL